MEPGPRSALKALFKNKGMKKKKILLSVQALTRIIQKERVEGMHRLRLQLQQFLPRDPVNREQTTAL